MSLDDPDLVRAQYATETGLEARRSIYANVEGDDARDVLFQAIAAARPRRLLEVGPGPGELSARIMAELGAEVIALDVSERMIELARGRRRRGARGGRPGASVCRCVVRHGRRRVDGSTTCPISIAA